MSRIGSLIIDLPAGVSVEEKGRRVTVKGPKGSLDLELRPEIDVEVEGTKMSVKPNGTGVPRKSRAYHGMTRALLNNMVVGVTEGYAKTLEIVGVGWNAQGQGQKLTLNIGFCHPVIFGVPEGLDVGTPKATTIVIKGTDKQAVGQFAARVRSVRPPEPYKGKGLRYQGETVKRKAGKTFGS